MSERWTWFVKCWLYLLGKRLGLVKYAQTECWDTTMLSECWDTIFEQKVVVIGRPSSLEHVALFGISLLPIHQ